MLAFHRTPQLQVFSMHESTPQHQSADEQVERQMEYTQLQAAIAQVEKGEYELLDVEDVKHRGRERMQESSP